MTYTADPPPSSLARAAGVLYFLVFALLLLDVATVRLDYILGAEYPLSSDAYFYLQEIKHRVETGSGYYTSFSPLLWGLGLLSKYGGLSHHGSFNAGVIASLVLMSAALLLFGVRGRRLWLTAGLIYFLWASDLLFFRQYAFLKQSFSLSLCFLGCALLRFSESKNSRGFVASGVGLCVIAAATHVFGALLALCLLSGMPAVARNRRLAIPGALLAVGAATIYLGTHPKEVLSLSLSELTPGLYAACSFAGCSEFEWAEVAVTAWFLLLLCGTGAVARSRNGVIWICWALCLLLNAPLWTSEGHMSYRLALSSLWVFLLGCGLTSSFNKQRIACFIVALMPACLALLKQTLPAREYLGPKMSVQVLTENSLALKHWIEPDSFVVAPHGIQFRVTYFLERRSGSSVPEGASHRNYFVLRKVSGLPRGCVPARTLTNTASLPATQCVDLGQFWIIQRLAI